MRKLFFISFAFISVTALSSCEIVAHDELGPCNGRYEPVCSDGITYWNECEARNSGVTEWSIGECEK